MVDRFTPSYKPTTVQKYGPIPSGLFDMGAIDIAGSIPEAQKIAANQASLEAAGRKRAEEEELAGALGPLMQDPNVDSKTLYETAASIMAKHGNTKGAIGLLGEAEKIGQERLFQTSKGIVGVDPKTKKAREIYKIEEEADYIIRGSKVFKQEPGKAPELVKDYGGGEAQKALYYDYDKEEFVPYTKEEAALRTVTKVGGGGASPADVRELIRRQEKSKKDVAKDDKPGFFSRIFSGSPAADPATAEQIAKFEKAFGDSTKKQFKDVEEAQKPKQDKKTKVDLRKQAEEELKREGKIK